MSTQRALGGVVLLLFWSGAVGLGAQERQAGPGRAGPDAPRSPRVAMQLANALDRYALVQAQRFLELNDAEYEQLVPRLRALQQVRRRTSQARHRLLQDLRRLTVQRPGREPDEELLRARLSALREHDERAAGEIRAAYAALDEIMTPRQQARFRLFEENLEARKLELLMRARARAARGGS